MKWARKMAEIAAFSFNRTPKTSKSEPAEEILTEEEKAILNRPDAFSSTWQRHRHGCCYDYKCWYCLMNKKMRA